MSQVTTARLYFLFALALLSLGWKVCHSASAQVARVQAAQAAQIERLLSANE